MRLGLVVVRLIPLLALPLAPLAITYASTPRDGAWRPMAQTDPITGQIAVYDPVRNRLLALCGDRLLALGLSGDSLVTGLWTRGPGLAGTPTYDPARDRLIVIGGANASFLELSESIPRWHAMAAPLPPGMSYNLAVLDASRDRMLLIGTNPGGTALTLWTASLDGLSGWAEISTLGSAPSTRVSFGAIYDPIRDRAIVVGGYAAGAYLTDAYQLTFGGTPTWSSLAPSGPPPPTPIAFACYDPPRDQLLAIDGGTRTYSLSLGGAPAWSEFGNGFGWRNSSHFSAYGAGRLFVYGGLVALTPHSTWTFNDVRELELSTLTARTLAPAAGIPVGGAGTSFIYDPVSQSAWLFGGTTGDSMRADTWRTTLVDGADWKRVAMDGALPDARAYASTIYDPVRRQMVVWGGYSNASGLFTDTWTLSLSDPPQWSPLATSGFAGDCIFPSTIYDPIRDRMILFGGYRSSGTSPGNRNLAFQLQLSGAPTWSLISTTPPTFRPPVRHGPVAIYDAPRDRMVIFGGSQDPYYGPEQNLLNDVWALSLSSPPSWTQLSPIGVPPTPRVRANAIYDPVGDRMILYGGMDAAGVSFEAWQLTLGGIPEWTKLTPEGAPPFWRLYPSILHDAAANRMVLFGGEYTRFLEPNIPLNSLWSLEFSGAPLAVEPPNGKALQLTSAYPNPAKGNVTFVLELPAPSSIRASVFDVTGREVKRFDERPLAAGRHRIEWDGRTSAGSSAAPGLYFVRVVSGEKSLHRTLVLMR